MDIHPNRWKKQLQTLQVHRPHDAEGTGLYFVRRGRRSNNVFSCIKTVDVATLPIVAA